LRPRNSSYSGGFSSTRCGDRINALDLAGRHHRAEKGGAAASAYR